MAADREQPVPWVLGVSTWAPVEDGHRRPVEEDVGHLVGGVARSAGLDPGEVAALDQHPRRSELVDPAGQVGHGVDVARRRWAARRPGGRPPTGWA